MGFLRTRVEYERRSLLDSGTRAVGSTSVSCLARSGVENLLEERKKKYTPWKLRKKDLFLIVICHFLYARLLLCVKCESI